MESRLSGKHGPAEGGRAALGVGVPGWALGAFIRLRNGNWRDVSGIVRDVGRQPALVRALSCLYAQIATSIPALRQDGHGPRDEGVT